MQHDLSAFLARHVPAVTERHVWGDGQLPLEVTCYLARELPPWEAVTSVRAVVLRGEDVLVLRNPDATHVVPGGRREPGEAFEEALRRELLEETGWRLAQIALLGFMHFHHLAPRLPDYAYPHPDFLQVVYRAEAAEYVPAARLADDYEQESGFLPVASARALDLEASGRLYLEAALQARASAGHARL